MNFTLTTLPLSLLHIVQKWLNSIEVCDPKVAQFICKLIPAHCPFERKIYFFNRLIIYIPPLCHFNPVYQQLISLRLRALSYLFEIEE
ncbi:Mo-dependent nitrogenase C-terminal domain-containing protein [Gloeocapsopsis dulcis]